MPARLSVFAVFCKFADMNKQCPRCGTVVPDYTNFCPQCGCDLMRPPHAAPPPYEQPSYVYSANNPFDASGPEGKCRGIAALLAILIGALGVHYFYLGKVGAGLLTLLLTLLTCSIWSWLMLAQGIYMFCITNEQFEQKYVATPSFFPLF